VDDYPNRAALLTGVPFSVRLLGAALLIAWAARRNWPWLVPFGVLIALPAVWWAALSIPLLAVPRLLLWHHSTQPEAEKRVVGKGAVAPYGL
jgi:hypothetical protein